MYIEVKSCALLQVVTHAVVLIKYYRESQMLELYTYFKL